LVLTGEVTDNDLETATELAATVAASAL
ncbi:flavodoxin, partial [Geobacillus sp. MMMUD3]|nr:flavodoxin [Geobacillus sp. MMMUD3]